MSEVDSEAAGIKDKAKRKMGKAEKKRAAAAALASAETIFDNEEDLILDTVSSVILPNHS